MANRKTVKQIQDDQTRFADRFAHLKDGLSQDEVRRISDFEKLRTATTQQLEDMQRKFSETIAGISQQIRSTIAKEFDVNAEERRLAELQFEQRLEADKKWPSNANRLLREQRAQGDMTRSPSAPLPEPDQTFSAPEFSKKSS